MPGRKPTRKPNHAPNRPPGPKPRGGRRGTAPAPPLRGRAALVTGAAKRVGAAVALRLAAAGADVAVHHNRSEAEALRTVRRAAALGVRSAPVRADLAQAPERRALVREAAAALGRPLDILVNNASVFPRCTLEELTLEHWVENLTVNAWAPFELTLEFARQVPARAAGRGHGQGHVVNFLDARIVDEDRRHVGYHLAKRSLADLTRLSALHLAPRVLVNAVAPGPTLAPPGTAPEEGRRLMERLSQRLPLRQGSRPEDLADAVAFLCGVRSTTGQVLFVDGGRHLGRQPVSQSQASQRSKKRAK